MTDVAEGIRYARLMGADIINLSLASAPGEQSANLAVLRSEIEAAQASGIIIVAAAGNGGKKVLGYPAAYTQYDNVIGVAASIWESGQTWAAYSNYGPGVDFAAPGDNIASTVRTDLGVYGLAENGTSFATPLVSGVFALMKARNSRLEPDEYIAIARATTQPAPAAPHGGNWAGSFRTSGWRRCR